MMHKSWCYLGKVPYYFSRSSIKFQGHTGQKKSPVLSQIKRFRTVTPVWIHQWIWNDAQSLRYYRRGALLFYEVIHQISRPRRLKNRRLESNLSRITRPVAAIKSLRFAMFFHYFKFIFTNPIILFKMANEMLKHIKNLCSNLYVEPYHVQPPTK